MMLAPLGPVDFRRLGLRGPNGAQRGLPVGRVEVTQRSEVAERSDSRAKRVGRAARLARAFKKKLA